MFVIFAGEYIYIFEFKVDKPVEDALFQEALFQEALFQIEEKDYASIYADSGKKIMRVRIVFSRKERNNIEWRPEAV